MKVLALYLPQYHEIAENNNWWGEGYTEWTAVKNAAPLFKNHNQPRIPLNNNYYDLADGGDTLRKQAKIAKEYNVFGFCFYHYWFGKKQLLEKPMEDLLRHKDIDINFCVCWANETWTRTWYGKSEEVLIEQEYGLKPEWERHFSYLNKFFRDVRYIKINNMPVVCIYRQADIPCLNEMLDYWDELAKKEGFDGLYIIASRNSVRNGPISTNLICAVYNFEPGYSTRNGMNIFDKALYFGGIEIKHILNRFFKTNIFERKISMHKINKRSIRNYIRDNNNPIKVFPGVSPRWDNTPRRGINGSIYYDDSPQEFKMTLESFNKLLGVDDFIFVNAWNEWGEGAYLEPDCTTRYEYLSVIKEVVGGRND